MEKKLAKDSVVFHLGFRNRDRTQTICQTNATLTKNSYALGCTQATLIFLNARPQS